MAAVTLRWALLHSPRTNTPSKIRPLGDYALNLNDNTGTGLAVNNCAVRSYAMSSNTDGHDDCAFGYSALTFNDTGSRNTAVGSLALWQNTSGSNNIALGDFAGQNLITGDNNIDIGNDGVADEAGTIRIGAQGTHTQAFVAGISGVAITGDPVLVSSDGNLEWLDPRSGSRMRSSR